MAFDSSQYFQTTAQQMQQSSSAAITNNITSFGNSIRAVGQQPFYIANDVVKTATGLPDLPLVNNLSLNGAIKLFKPPEKTGIDGVIKNITGVSLSQTFSVQGAKALGTYLGNALSVLVSQIKDAAIACIDQNIQSAINNNSIANLIFNYNFNKSQLLGNATQKLDRKFFTFTNDLFYKKLQIQQIALYRQKILEGIQSVCNKISPNTLKQYQVNPSLITSNSLLASTKVTNNIQILAQQTGKVSTTWKSVI